MSRLLSSSEVPVEQVFASNGVQNSILASETIMCVSLIVVTDDGDRAGPPSMIGNEPNAGHLMSPSLVMKMIWFVLATMAAANHAIM